MRRKDYDELCWHAMETAQVLEELGASREQGLSSQEIPERQRKWGLNALPEGKKASILRIFLTQFQSPLIYLLIAAALIAWILGERNDASVIMVVVIANAIIGTIQEGRAKRSVEALRRLSSLKATVCRDGKTLKVEASEIVPGDLLLLSSGDAITADGRLIEAASLEVAEAALTGESLPVEKKLDTLPEATQLSERFNMVYSGTHVTSGRAKLIVVATGTNTEVGKIASLTSEAEEAKTPLERRIEQFGRYLILAALIVFGLILSLGWLKGFPFSQIFLIGVSQIVSMIPEGLPVAVTVALAVGVQRMAARKAIVRKLSAVEALGSISVICTDKTGTLTRNEMTVKTIFIPGEEPIEVSGTGYSPEGELRSRSGEVMAISHSNTPSSTPLNPEAKLESKLERLLLSAVLCNDSNLSLSQSTADGWDVIGDPTEGSLLVVAMKAGMNPSELRFSYPRAGEVPFDSAKKMMATEHRISNETVIFIKGAPEALLPLCRESGSDAVRAREGIQEAFKMADRMASNALRVLAFGEVRGANLSGESDLSRFKGQIELQGLMGQLDPPREEAYTAVSESLAAGIRPVMVTGDHKSTAKTIAEMIGIYKKGDQAVDGAELEEMSEAEFRSRVGQISVFARVHPKQKYRIVEALQEDDEVVAMTGDGVNDAPALARANVGVAMGVTGTDVAKDAAKIIITDDNFATIVSAVAEGRLIYRNIRKLILYLFSTGSAEILVLISALLMGYPPPLAAVMILWVNLVTDGALSITLIMEKAEGDEMQHRPIPLKEPVLTRPILKRIAIMAPVMTLSTLSYYLIRFDSGMSFDEVRTGTFTVLVVSQWLNALNCRSETRSVFSMSILGNPWFMGGLIFATLLQASVIFVPKLNEIFYTSPLPFQEALLIAALSSLVLWVEELRKLWRRLKQATHAH